MADTNSLHAKLFKTVVQDEERVGTKITVVGVGAVGMACAFSILTQNVAQNVAIVDIMADKLKGEMMDLQHGSYFMRNAKVEASTNYDITAGSNICVVTAGARQQEGETRLSLVQRNVNILKGIIPQLVQHSPNTILMIVSNPVDILTHVAWKISGLPQNRVIGSGTNLDSLRFRFLLSQQLKVAVESVHGWIIGEHGDSSVPLWSGVNVAGVTISDIDTSFGTPESEAKYSEIHRQVVSSAYDIIKLKGSTSWAIGLSVSQLCTTILHHNSRVHCVTTLAKGLHDINDEIFLSLPCVLGRNGIHSVVKQKLKDDERAKLQKSAKTMKEVMDGIKL